MNITFRLIQINVSDVRRAEDFYVGLLGFAKDEDASFRNVTVLTSAHGFPVLLYPVRDVVERPYPESTGPMLVIEVEDIFRTKAEWEQKGVEFIPIPWSEDDSGIAGCPFGNFIAFKDPDGNVHEIIQRER